MLDNAGNRQLAYVVVIDNILPIEGSDNCECAIVGGWQVMVRKNEFQPKDLAIYFEIDSQLDSSNPVFAFMKNKKYKVKTQKYTFGGKGKFISQGLLMSAEDFGWHVQIELKPNSDFDSIKYIKDNEGNKHFIENESRFLTKQLNIKHCTTEDNVYVKPVDKYKRMIQQHNELFSHQPFKYLIKHLWGKKLLFVFFHKKKNNNSLKFPTCFPYIKKTDQERVENMTWVLNDKTPFIVTQKCDGSSATYILEKKKILFKNKYEFYVCSRNIRQLNPEQKSFYNKNYYWECAIKYDIENKMKDYLKQHPKLKYICWQGEICGPEIQNNPHGLIETHLFCFHMIDSKIGKYDIRNAVKIWKEYNMEIVPIVNENYILPDNFEDFKESADGVYDASCCEGKTNQPREGFVYYKTTDPNFSFKNVSKIYLLKYY